MKLCNQVPHGYLLMFGVQSMDANQVNTLLHSTRPVGFQINVVNDMVAALWQCIHFRLLFLELRCRSRGQFPWDKEYNKAVQVNRQGMLWHYWGPLLTFQADLYILLWPYSRKFPYLVTVTPQLYQDKYFSHHGLKLLVSNFRKLVSPTQFISGHFIEFPPYMIKILAGRREPWHQ